MEVISREEALEQGLPYYFTGKPCKRGHIDRRTVASRNCYSCANEFRRNKTATNPEWREACNAAAKKRWCENPEVRERDKLRTRKRRAENEAYRQQQKEYKRRNMKKITAQNAARKHRMKSLPEHRDEIFMIYEDAATIGYHVDHIVPIAEGGKHEPSNLQIVSPTYNLSKGARLLNYTERQI